MATLIPTYNWTDFLKLVKSGRTKELKSCEIKFNSEYLFTFINPSTEFIRTQAEYLGENSNGVGGKSLEKIMRVTRMIGRSVIRGEADTFIPSFTPCFRVSNTTRVNNGPGISPLKPRRKPDIMNVISESIKGYQA